MKDFPEILRLVNSPQRNLSVTNQACESGTARTHVGLHTLAPELALGAASGVLALRSLPAWWT